MFLGALALAAAAQAASGKFVKTTLVDDSQNPMEVDVAEDGRVFYIERFGDLRVWDPGTEQVSTIGHINVYTGQENGLLGLALAPDFSESNELYLAYSVPPQNTLTQRVSRFTLTPQGQLNISSEEVIYEWTHQRQQCCHSAGALEFGPDGSLYISTGDNTNPHASGGYTPIDERPGREAWDAQRTSANTANPNGKILRIVPNPDGPGHTIPDGNLFVDDDPKTLPEIYAMGFRNPFRFKVDPETGWIEMGDYGPDANAADPARGPQGSVEFNLITEPGNFGWPYCIRENVPYIDFQFPDGPSGLPFNCASPVNDSPNNTGLENLPPAVPATMWLGYTETDARFPGLGTGGAPMGGPIYHYDPDNPSPTKFPEEFDGKWFIGEWNENWIKTVTLDDEGEALSVAAFPGLDYRRPMDMTFGPDGSLYVIEWGSGFNSGGAGNDDSGVYRIDWEPSLAPDVTATAEPSRGPAPLEVSFEVEATNPNGTPNPDFTYEWDFGDGSPTSDEEDPTHTYTDPGVFDATVTVTDPDTGGEATATVRVRVDACPIRPSDEFNGDELDRSRWDAIFRENPDTLSLGGGKLTITTEAGDIWRTDTNPPPNNFILQSADHAGENWTIETKLSGTISGGNSQGGLIAFGDTDNYVKIDAVARPNEGRISQIELRSEVNRSPQSPQPNVNVPEGTTDIWLRLTKQGTTYSGAYSFDGQNWTAMSGSVPNAMESPRFGVYALGAEESGEEVSFDYFRVDGRPGTDNPCVCVIPADDFEAGELDRERWDWIVREDESLYRFEDGVLWIETPPGDIYQNQNPSQTRNFILQDGARGGDNWAIETKVLVGNLNQSYQQGGLIAYADDNNYVKLDAVADTSSQRAARVELVSEQNGSAQRREANVPEGVTEIWLRLNKQGNTYSGAYSFDGESWQTVSGTLQNQLQSPGFGIYTLGTGAPGPEVGFEYFDFSGELDCPVVNDPPAIASVTADPAHGFAPLEVSFSVQVTDGDGDPLSYAWDFGDGGTAEGPSPTHTYTEPGAYEAKVTVSDGASQRSRKVEVLVLPEDDPSARFRALVFSKTEGFRHDSIPAGHAAIDELAEQHDFQVDHTEDASLFEPAILDRYDTVVFLSTTGDVLNAQQEAAFEEYIRDGGGFVGVHAAADTEYDWAWYGDLVGAYFMSHPPGTATADVVVEDHEHPSTASLPGRYEHEDEWYNFESPDFFGFADEDYSPRGTVHVLASVDEETYDEQDGTPEADDHPITWCQRFDGGRSWYTGMGHTAESFSEEHFLTQLLGGLETTAGVTPSEPCGEVPGADTKPPRSTARLNPDSPGPGGTYDQPVEVIFEATDGDREPPEPQTHDVQAEGFEWDPDRLEITAGDEVQWNFPETAGAGHDVWLIPPGGDEDDAFEVSDGVVSPGGDPVSYTLDEPGRWQMFCSLRPGMDGLIDVDPAPAPASGVDYVEYRVITGLDATEWARLDNSDDDEPFVASVVISDEGEHTVEFRSVDRAGNRELSRSVQFTVVPPAPCVAYSDEFDESDPKWAFRHPTSPLTLVTGGSLLFFLGSGEIDQDGTGPVNFIGQPIPEGDFEITAELRSTGLAGDGSGANGYAQAGLMLYQSDDNFVKVTHTRAGVLQPADQGKTFFEVGAETDGVIARSPQVGLAADNPDTWWLRLVREGDELTAYYATESPAEDGEWNEIPMSDGMDLSEIMPPENGPIYMGFYGANGSTSVSARWFRVVPDVDCDPPVIEELTAEPASGTAPLEVAFSVTASDEQVDELTYEWDFGDGSPTSDEEDPTHTYTKPGVYEAKVTVSDGTYEVSDTVEVTVENSPPVIESVGADPQDGIAPLEVSFSVVASDSDGDELTYEWDFGDGSPVSDEEAPTHVYAEPGTYDATVTVSDGTDEVSESVRVEVGGLPRLAVTVKPKSRAIRAAKRRVAYRVVLRNDGNAAAEGVKVCAKAKKKLLAVKGKACRAVSVSRGERVKQRFVLKVKPAARGKRTKVRFVVSGAGLAKQTKVAKLKVRR